MLYLVRIGLGVALAPATVANCVIPGVVLRPPCGTIPEVEVVVAWRKSDLSAGLKAFLETVDVVPVPGPA